jgi:hypothetical protein
MDQFPKYEYNTDHKLLLLRVFGCIGRTELFSVNLPVIVNGAAVICGVSVGRHAILNYSLMLLLVRIKHTHLF